MSKIYGDDGGDKETSDGTVSRADRDGNRSKSEITLSDVLGTTIDQQGQRGRTSAESKIQLGREASNDYAAKGGDDSSKGVSADPDLFLLLSPC